MILNDKQIKKLAEQDGMITPFVNKSVQDDIPVILHVLKV